MNKLIYPKLQFSSVQSLSHVQLCDSMNRSTPGLPVHYQLPEFTQTHVHWVSDAIQPSHPLSPPSPPVFNLSQHQGLFHWVSSLYQVAKVLEFQLQHQAFQWTPRTDFPEIKPSSPASQADSLSAEPQGNPRILEWVAYPFSRGSSRPRNWTRVSCIAGGFFTN